MRATNLNYHFKPQSWVDPLEYPFKHNYCQLQEGNMHYVDEGKGDILLFIHGTPTWSFLYREYIKSFSYSYRCIAIDHLGFGLSEKPEGFEGTPQDHAENLSEFINKLDLQDVTLVVHDFGGPIGLNCAIESSEKIKRIVLFNSWLWETQSNPTALKVHNFINSWFGQFLYLRLNFSTKFLLKKVFKHKKNLSNKIHQHYINPFPDKQSRQALLNLAKSLVGSSDWYQQQWENLSSIEKVPWLILWGTQDELVTTDYLAKWTSRLPHAEVKTFDCGHFVQEESTFKSICAMDDFLKRTN